MFALMAAGMWIWLTPSILASVRSPSYIPVTGKVVQTRVRDHESKGRRVWDVEVTYAYEVNGREYTSRRIQGAQIWQPYSSAAQAELVAAGYPVGSAIQVFHDPRWPSLSTRTRVPDEWPVLLIVPCMPTVLSVVIALICRHYARKRRLSS